MEIKGGYKSPECYYCNCDKIPYAINLTQETKYCFKHYNIVKGYQKKDNWAILRGNINEV